MQSGGKGPYAEPLPESEKRHLSKYGKLPRGGSLGQDYKERTYSEPGDFALSTSHQVTDNGTIQTGNAHPHRDSISHPYSPTPAASNVDKDANEYLHRRDASPQKSLLHRQTNIGDKDPTNDDGQDNLFCFEY